MIFTGKKNCQKNRNQATVIDSEISEKCTDLMLLFVNGRLFKLICMRYSFLKHPKNTKSSFGIVPVLLLSKTIIF